MGIVRNFWWYRYYDTPEGEDCFHKTFYMSKWLFTGGCGWGLVEAWFNRHLIAGGPRATGVILRALTHSAFPAAAVGATFGAVACMSSALRKKEDDWNYTVGGLAAGAVFGALIMKSVAHGSIVMIFFGIGGYLKRTGMHGNFNFHSNPDLIRKNRIVTPSLWWRDYGNKWWNIEKFQPNATRYYFPSNTDPLPVSFTGGADLKPTQPPVYGTPSEPGKGFMLR
ncbi:hypothetical protein RvY_17288 [Ramazzottius varieornatus]|uniref:NADH dehydrogenase [ubiquinone] 1 alpha subcomplex subunit 11 n=1 Tax=Ramazzottius varieornatus TaxID=947166 RepID=A0A1D1W5J6_RAMVA|nr:hypothetical protein RvY_17288 [Ramazzottius varieornatus]